MKVFPDSAIKSRLQLVMNLTAALFGKEALISRSDTMSFVTVNSKAARTMSLGVPERQTEIGFYYFCVHHQ